MVIHQVARLDGDGIGHPQKLPDGSDSKITHLMLPSIVDQVVDAINEQQEASGGDTIEMVPFDLSAEARMENLDPDQLTAYYARMIAAIMDAGGRFMKMPTTTPTQQEVEADMAEHPDRFVGWDPGQIAAYKALHMKSPNNRLRNGADLQVMERPFYPDETLAVAPEGFSELDVRTPDAPQFFVETVDGLARELDRVEMENYVRSVLASAADTGKDILVTTKHTISPLDRRFWHSFQEIATAEFGDTFAILNTPEKKARAEAFKTEGKILLGEHLFDSFLPEILINGHEGKILACLPDQAAILHGLQNIGGMELSGVTQDMPTRVVCRVPKGSGYGEKIYEEGDKVGETHTLPEDDIRKTATRAAEVAAKRETRPILVLVSGNNPADEQLEDIVKNELGEGNYDVMTLSDILQALALVPNSSLLNVFITTNQIGDYLSDYLAPLHYGKLGRGALGACENMNLSYTEAGDIRVIGTDPSTGTAPTLANEKMAHHMLPAGALLSLATLLIEDKRLPDGLNQVGVRLRRSVLETLTEHGAMTDHSGFTADVIAKLAA